MEKAELRKSETKRSTSLDAWDYFLRGRAFLHQLTPEDVVRARAMFERAVELDPQYSDAWAGLSWTYQREILFDVVEDRRAWEGKALEAARRAVALDNGSSFAHLALCACRRQNGRECDVLGQNRLAGQHGDNRRWYLVFQGSAQTTATIKLRRYRRTKYICALEAASVGGLFSFYHNRDVPYWPKADIAAASANVRFRG